MPDTAGLFSQPPGAPLLRGARANRRGLRAGQHGGYSPPRTDSVGLSRIGGVQGCAATVAP